MARKSRNSLARWRVKQRPATLPVATSSAAKMVCETPFERGTAAVRARVERDHVTGSWLLDSYEVRSDRFTRTLRR